MASGPCMVTPHCIAAHQGLLSRHEQVAAGVVVGAGLAGGALPQVEGVREQGPGQGQAANAAPEVLKEAAAFQGRGQTGVNKECQGWAALHGNCSWLLAARCEIKVSYRSLAFLTCAFGQDAFLFALFLCLRLDAFMHVCWYGKLRTQTMRMHHAWPMQPPASAATSPSCRRCSWSQGATTRRSRRGRGWRGGCGG